MYSAVVVGPECVCATSCPESMTSSGSYVIPIRGPPWNWHPKTPLNTSSFLRWRYTSSTSGPVLPHGLDMINVPPARGYMYGVWVGVTQRWIQTEHKLPIMELWGVFWGEFFPLTAAYPPVFFFSTFSYMLNRPKPGWICAIRQGVLCDVGVLICRASLSSDDGNLAGLVLILLPRQCLGCSALPVRASSGDVREGSFRKCVVSVCVRMVCMQSWLLLQDTHTHTKFYCSC